MMYERYYLVLILMLVTMAGCMPQTKDIQQSSLIEEHDTPAEAMTTELPPTAMANEENIPEQAAPSEPESVDEELARIKPAEAAREEKSSEQVVNGEVKPVDDTSTAVKPTLETITRADPDQMSAKPPDRSLRLLTEKARADLAKVLDLELGEIRLIEARATEWPDAGLGCPRPEMTYVDVITPGYWIVFEANDQIYTYHTDNEDQVVLCMFPRRESSDQRPDMPIIPVDPGEIKDGIPWVPVK